MPKIIDDPKAKILAVAKETLFANGYAGFSLRGVAAACALSVGTIYNYYPNKDTLIASVMIEDWQIAIGKMQAAAQSAPCIGQGIGAFYAALCAFSGIYQDVWAQFASTSGAAQAVSSRHHMIRGQIDAQLHTLLARLGNPQDAQFIPLVAEALLASVAQPDITHADIVALAERIFGCEQA